MAKVIRDYAEINKKLLEGFIVAEVITGINTKGSGMMIGLGYVGNITFPLPGVKRGNDNDY